MIMGGMRTHREEQSIGPIRSMHSAHRMWSAW